MAHVDLRYTQGGQGAGMAPRAWSRRGAVERGQQRFQELQEGHLGSVTWGSMAGLLPACGGDGDGCREYTRTA